VAKPVIADNKPISVDLEAGEEYYFCACGRSEAQPFCDGSHVGTDFVPHEFTADEDGEFMLCQCKHTASPPFCDGTHAKCGFDGTETADRSPILNCSKSYEGPQMRLTDNKGLCALARFCDPHGGVWNMVTMSDDPEIKPVFLQEVQDCPAGRLVAWDKKTAKAIEPYFEPSIVLIEDPHKKCSGPIWVRGGIPLIGSDGTPYEVRNRVTLCRCGASENKPSFNRKHLSIHFKAT